MFPPGMPRPELSLALGGLLDGPDASAVSRGCESAVRAGCRSVQVSASERATRPREMGRSARRDLAALVRRHGLTCSGVDLFVPARHLMSPETIDRAAEALLAAAELAGELGSLTGGRGVLATALPTGAPNRGADGAKQGDASKSKALGTIGQVVAAVVERAAAAGAVVADHAWAGGDEASSSWEPLGVKRGVDPAAVVLKGGDAERAVAVLAETPGRLAAVRLSDLSSEGRVAPGEGELDVFGYAVSIMTAFRDEAPPPLVVDLRGVKAEGGVAELVERACNAAGGGSDGG